MSPCHELNNVIIETGKVFLIFHWDVVCRRITNVSNGTQNSRVTGFPRFITEQNRTVEHNRDANMQRTPRHASPTRRCVRSESWGRFRQSPPGQVMGRGFWLDLFDLLHSFSPPPSSAKWVLMAWKEGERIVERRKRVLLSERGEGNYSFTVKKAQRIIESGSAHACK